MGCNYYVEDDPTCNNPAHVEKLHIGKSSAGWVFGFHAIADKGLVSWAAWRKFLANRKIVNEYGDEISHEDFCAMVKAKQISVSASRLDLAVRNNVEVWGRTAVETIDDKKEWLDFAGYDFSSHEFC